MADATSILNEISGALDAMATQVIALVGDDRSFVEIWGWNVPGLSRTDLADYIRKPRDVIQRIEGSSVSDTDLQRLSQFPARIAYIRGNTIPNMTGGNAGVGYVTISGLIDSLGLILERYDAPPLDLKRLEDRKLLPAAQIRQLRRMADAIDQLAGVGVELDRKISEINVAHQVAEALPADMRSLEDARQKFEAARREIEVTSREVQTSKREIEATRDQLAAISAESESVLSRANKAYSAATTVGLGAAFEKRAIDLSRTTAALGILLVLTLGVGAAITYSRVEFVHQLMKDPRISYGILWLNLSFTGISISAPVWLAWLLTRQIGQRFRLAEDYGYKASVAKAYEGYRAEAAHIDEELSKRLFAIALDRLEEAPLRLIEKDSPGSPVHEARAPIARWLLPQRRPAAPPAAARQPEDADS